MKTLDFKGKIKTKLVVLLYLFFATFTWVIYAQTNNSSTNSSVFVRNPNSNPTPGQAAVGSPIPLLVAVVPPIPLTFTPTVTGTLPTATPTGSATPTPTFTGIPQQVTFPTPIVNMPNMYVTIAGSSTPVTQIIPYGYNTLGVNFVSGSGLTVVNAFVSGAVTTLGAALPLWDSQGKLLRTSSTTTNDLYQTNITGAQGLCFQPNGAVSCVMIFSYNVTDSGANSTAHILQNPTATANVNGFDIIILTNTPTCGACTGTPTPTATPNNPYAYIQNKATGLYDIPMDAQPSLTPSPQVQAVDDARNSTFWSQYLDSIQRGFNGTYTPTPTGSPTYTSTPTFTPINVAGAISTWAVAMMTATQTPIPVFYPSITAQKSVSATGFIGATIVGPGPMTSAQWAVTTIGGSGAVDYVCYYNPNSTFGNWVSCGAQSITGANAVDAIGVTFPPALDASISINAISASTTCTFWGLGCQTNH